MSRLSLDNVGSLTSHNPIGLQGLLRDSFTFTLHGFFTSSIQAYLLMLFAHIGLMALPSLRASSCVLYRLYSIFNVSVNTIIL
jgi:hypothetical protein